MNYGEIITVDCANGTGIRLSLFVSGCRNHCKNCFQPETWDFTYGKPFTEETVNFILSELTHSYYDGLTILGGEPFEEENQFGLVDFIEKVSGSFPSKNIWIYTGYNYEDLLEGGKKHTSVTDEILKRTDILVDGAFCEDKKNLMLKFRGSSNQRIIDVKKTRKLGQVVLSPLMND